MIEEDKNVNKYTPYLISLVVCEYDMEFICCGYEICLRRSRRKAIV